MTEHGQPFDPFITRWRASAAAERANYQLFLIELCDLLGVDRPGVATADPAADAYVFEKPVPLAHGATGFIDLYRRGCFILEAKQGSDPVAQAVQLASGSGTRKKGRRGTAIRGTSSWDTALEKARRQAQTYARGLPPAELTGGGRPPFLIVVDVGNTIELYSEFTRSGGNYVPFPDPHSYRLTLDDLRHEAARDRLRAVWTEPLSLDPTRRSARVTRGIAERLATLALSLEGTHDPETVAQFLMRCLFTMFAEDVRLLPERAFTDLLRDLLNDPAGFKPMVEHLWGTMNNGGFSVILRRAIPRFNGGLFADPTALPLDEAQIQLLIDAARADWRDVEPAIFGALLERALNPIERHKLGAHYTPRAYVERLVVPTIVEPLRAEWESVQAAAAQLAGNDERKAIAEVAAFHRRLAATRVLDPACGTGNFLYVTLEHLKRLEGEVLNTLRDLGHGQLSLEMESVMVTPQQLLGIEVNPRAAAIAELVLWIGYLQWHLRTRGDVRPAEPIIRDFHNIERRDAVLDWDATEPLLDPDGRPVTRWDGRTTRPHPVTGEQVPDETARVPVLRYLNPRPAHWPAAEFIVGNPPFIGNKRMRYHLGDGYADALRTAYKADVPESADFVMYWWYKAARLLRKSLKRFGLITTNSISQSFNRRVLEKELTATPLISLVFAIPDHPWVDEELGASVRIAMTVADTGESNGTLLTVRHEFKTDDIERDIVFDEKRGYIHPDLTVGANVSNTSILNSNSGLAHQGVIPLGTGFRLTTEQVEALGYDVLSLPPVIKNYMIGRDLVQRPEQRFIIDFYGLNEEEIRRRYPALYQIVLDRVKPERDQKERKKNREIWWIYAEPRATMRPALSSIERYIATCRTAKHRLFSFIPSTTIPDAKLIAIALDDAYFLGVLSSHIHVTWSLATGAWLGVGNDSNYNHSDCFGKFPFPDPTPAQRTRIRELGEQLDAHRKRQQAQHPRLTLTDTYNVLAKLRAGDPLTDADRRIHEQGLVSVLRQLHDDLDAAVLDAYGWTDHPTDDTILQRLVALNTERAAEESTRAHIRWLRPDYQAPDAAAPVSQPALLEEEATVTATPSPTTANPWPAGLAARAAAVRAALAGFGRPVTAEEVTRSFNGKATQARLEQIEELLQTLAALGQARQAEDGQWSE